MCLLFEARLTNHFWEILTQPQFLPRTQMKPFLNIMNYWYIVLLLNVKHGGIKLLNSLRTCLIVEYCFCKITCESYISAFTQILSYWGTVTLISRNYSAAYTSKQILFLSIVLIIQLVCLVLISMWYHMLGRFDIKGENWVHSTAVQFHMLETKGEWCSKIIRLSKFCVSLHLSSINSKSPGISSTFSSPLFPLCHLCLHFSRCTRVIGSLFL